MISITKVKELVGNDGLSDNEAEQIRDACYAMAELIFETWNCRAAIQPDHAKTITRRSPRLTKEVPVVD